MLKAIQLLPCPHCGGEARYFLLCKCDNGRIERWQMKRFEVGEEISANNTKEMYEISCIECGAMASVDCWNKRMPFDEQDTFNRIDRTIGTLIDLKTYLVMRGI